MVFEWDEEKRRSNLRKHRIDFADAARVFYGPTVTWLDVRFEYGEPRFIAYGLLNGRVVAVVYTETPVAIRIISMRKATQREETHYFENFKD